MIELEIAMNKPAGQILQTLINTRLRQDIVSMHAYAIQDSAGMVKLDAMENPHRLSADLQVAGPTPGRAGTEPLPEWPRG